MTTVARFRLFGRAPAREGPPPGAPAAHGGSPYGPQAPYGPPPPAWGAPAPAGPPPVGAGAPWPAPGVAGPATRAARPVLPPASGYDDPPTDPHGFPPIAAVPVPALPVPLPPQATGPALPHQPAQHPWGQAPSPAVPDAPHPAEAAALAGAFAVDYLSWDEDDPQRRGRVLQDYLAAPATDPAHLGWAGRGRQRAEFALPGRVSPDGDGRVLVDVRVRVTPYRSVGDRGPDNVPESGDVAGTPAVAPAPTGRGWRSLASSWIRLSVPVALEGARLVIDAGEEILGEEPAPPPSTTPATDDHTLAEDDPLAEPRAAGAW
ncbi:hypothetical protein ACQPZA_02895 [Pseudonocardia xinjiangensis]|uniref:hypothetical protein n=1 Tax=Pseudonocardia xinjiangensis TaxID=75289 RepID=UPI003D8CA3FB